METCLPSEDKDFEHSQTSLTHLERVGEERVIPMIANVVNCPAGNTL